MEQRLLDLVAAGDAAMLAADAAQREYDNATVALSNLWNPWFKTTDKWEEDMGSYLLCKVYWPLYIEGGDSDAPPEMEVARQRLLTAKGVLDEAAEEVRRQTELHCPSVEPQLGTVQNWTEARMILISRGVPVRWGTW